MNIINSFGFRLWAGSLLCASISAWLILMFGQSNDYFLNINVLLAFIVIFIAHFLSAYSIYSVSKFPGNKPATSILPITLFWFLSIYFVFNHFLNLNFPFFVFAIIFFVSVCLSYLGFLVRTKKKFAMYFIPIGRAEAADELPDVEWYRLEEPALGPEKVDAIVVDLHSQELNNSWQKFLAECTLAGMPVYNIRQVEESLTGRVKIRHMYENTLGSLLPSPIYMGIKRFLDTLLIIATFPITLPIMLITAVAVKLESEGPALFIQNRVGKGGKEFRIYKFRSMCKDSEKEGAQFASAGDMRVTRIGKFIRKTRIDELPQFFNVLKGDMSLIGPRPEQKFFVDQFEKEIPFYNYRHIVRPGISGWAQVVHGYAADADETRVKIEHDFYYIKNFSLSLDVLIVFKTLKTMLTGFGAR